MAFSALIESIDQKTREKLAKELLITPEAQKIPNALAARLPSAAVEALTSAPTAPFSFFSICGKDIRLPLFYARSVFGPESVPGDAEGSKWERMHTSATMMETRDHQIPIIEEAMTHLKQHSTTTIQAQPGAGKTFMALTLAVSLGLRTAVLTPRETLNDQWKTTFAKVSTGDSEKIVEGSVFIPRQAAFESKRVEDPSPDLIVSLVDRVKGMSKSLRDSVGTLIIDEAHMMCTPSRVESLLSFTPRYIIVLTATLERNDSAHRMMHLLAGTHDIFRPPERPYKLIALQSGVEGEERLNRVTGLLDFSHLISSLASNVTYNEIIADTVAANPNRKFIILTSLVAHTKALCTMIKARGVSSDIMCGNKKKYGDCRALVATRLKVGTGFDAATFAGDFDGVSPDTLILATTIKSWQQYTQCVGRVMRARPGVTPVVVWMLSRNSVTSRHLAGLKKYISSSGGVVEKVSAIETPAGKGVVIDA
jgi:superfamily II DNA or RNA helicase